jgi:hypothetical protein
MKRNVFQGSSSHLCRLFYRGISPAHSPGPLSDIQKDLLTKSSQKKGPDASLILLTEKSKIQRALLLRSRSVDKPLGCLLLS